MNAIRSLFFLIPVLLFGDSQDHLAKFTQYFQQQQFREGLAVLDCWETEQPWHTGAISGMKAAVYLSLGRLEESKTMLEKAIPLLTLEGFSTDSLQFIEEMHKNAINFSYEEYPYVLQTSFRGADFYLCNCQQPTGVKFKYWFGAGEVLIGILAIPFSPPLAMTLISTGSAIFIDATADALDNKAAWERNLQDRQRISPD